jgi:beta-N-acetylhexosaminidase
MAWMLAACSAPAAEPTTQPDARPGTSATTPSSDAPGSSPSAEPGAPSSPAPTGSATPSPSPGPDGQEEGDPLAGWTLEQKVGQLLMVGVSVTDPADVSRTSITEHHVGNVFLHGRSEAGVDATRDLVERYTGLVSQSTTRGTPLLVATDQEGGLVQVLRGPGFSEIPRATQQAKWQPATLERRARRWGNELAAAGVNLNLGPVMDLVPREEAENNPPIGYFSRNYGFTARSVTASANAFSAGQRAAGVEPVIKHFPGLGRVTQNTDTSTDVTDSVTTARSASVGIFRSGIDAGARFVMMSTAEYQRIDPGTPASFSRVIVHDLLRGRLGFDGVVMTDDLSAAAQATQWSPGERAVRAVEAGVDVVLASADPSVVPEMADALVARARDDADFAAKVDLAASRVLAAKSDIVSG